MNKDEEIKIDLRKECELTSSETRGIDFLLGRHSRSVLMSLKKGLMMAMMTMMMMMMMSPASSLSSSLPQTLLEPGWCNGFGSLGRKILDL